MEDLNYNNYIYLGALESKVGEGGLFGGKYNFSGVKIRVFNDKSLCLSIRRPYGFETSTGCAKFALKITALLKYLPWTVAIICLFKFLLYS